MYTNLDCLCSKVFNCSLSSQFKGSPGIDVSILRETKDGGKKKRQNEGNKNRTPHQAYKAQYYFRRVFKLTRSLINQTQ